MLKKILTMTAAAAVILTGCKGTSTIDDLPSESQTEPPPVTENSGILNFTPPQPGEKIAVITVKDYGEIKIKLFPEEAPEAVENFIGLAEMEYYDELIFHRVIEEFMIQGGDPRGDGTGGKSIWGEKFEGGVSDKLFHFAGAVAYANSGATSTNGSQFYIVNTPEGKLNGADTFEEFEAAGYSFDENVKEMYLEKGGVPFLDGGYTVFGQVIEGMDVVRAISKVETNSPEVNKPLKQVVMESIRIVEYQP